MAAAYWVLTSDDLMAGPTRWPPFLRPVRRDETTVPPDNFTHWWLFEDDDSPAEFDGKRVELTFTRTVGRVSEDSPERTETWDVERVLAR